MDKRPSAQDAPTEVLSATRAEVPFAVRVYNGESAETIFVRATHYVIEGGWIVFLVDHGTDPPGFVARFAVTQVAYVLLG